MSCQVCRRDCGHRWSTEGRFHIMTVHDQVVGLVTAESNGWSYGLAERTGGAFSQKSVFWKASLPDAIASVEALVAARRIG